MVTVAWIISLIFPAENRNDRGKEWSPFKINAAKHKLSLAVRAARQ